MSPLFNRLLVPLTRDEWAKGDPYGLEDGYALYPKLAYPYTSSVAWWGLHPWYEAERQQAKVSNFGLPYHAGPQRIIRPVKVYR